MPSRRSQGSFRPALDQFDPRILLSAVVGGAFAGYLWPTNQIPYVIDPSVKNAGIIVQAINEYNDETTMQWVPRTDQSDYVDFQYAPLTSVGEGGEASEGHWGGEQFAGVTPYSNTSTILHEMGHVSGLWHEQNRLDASSFVIINYQNLLPADDSIWAPGNASSVRDIGPFDYSSIMLYSGYVGSANGQPVATEPNGTVLPVNVVLSAEDKSTLDSLYPAPAGQAQVPGQVSASAVSSNQIKITWSDTNAGQADYTVERAVAGQGFTTIATLPGGSTSYIDSQASPGVLYQYMLVANTSANIPAVSQIAYAAISPRAPTLIAAVNADGSVTLTWNDPYGNQATDYQISASGITSNGSGSSNGGAEGPETDSYTFPAGSLDLSNTRWTFQIFGQAGENPALWTGPSSNTASVGTYSGPGPGSGPSSTQFAPQVLGVIDVHFVKKKTTSLSIAFSRAMVPSSVENPALYNVRGGMLLRRKSVYRKTIKIKGVTYNPATQAVLVQLAKPYRGRFRVSLDGTIDSLDGVSAFTTFSEIV